MQPNPTGSNQIPAASQPPLSKEKQLTVSYDHRVYSITTENDVPEGHLIKHALEELAKNTKERTIISKLKIPDVDELELPKDKKVPKFKTVIITYKILDITESKNRDELAEPGKRTFADKALINVLDVRSNILEVRSNSPKKPIEIDTNFTDRVDSNDNLPLKSASDDISVREYIDIALEEFKKEPSDKKLIDTTFYYLLNKNDIDYKQLFYAIKNQIISIVSNEYGSTGEEIDSEVSETIEELASDIALKLDSLVQDMGEKTINDQAEQKKALIDLKEALLQGMIADADDNRVEEIDSETFSLLSLEGTVRPEDFIETDGYTDNLWDFKQGIWTSPEKEDELSEEEEEPEERKFNVKQFKFFDENLFRNTIDDFFKVEDVQSVLKQFFPIKPKS